jgi:3,4-dihydroxy-2-butanone 4-phosphate synthase
VARKLLTQLLESQRRDYLDLEILVEQSFKVEGHPFALLIYKCSTETGASAIGRLWQIRAAIYGESQIVTPIASWFEKEDDASQEKA